MRGVIVLIASFLLLGCGGKAAPEVPVVLIAHAGGEVDGYVYTNSREALEKAIKKVITENQDGND